MKRAYAKRKIVSVPELLSVRAELANQTEQIQIEPDDSQQFNEFLILNKEADSNETNNFIKTNVNEIDTTSGGGCIEILDQPILNAPLATDNSTISYNISQNSVLVLTPDGNYMIANLDDDVTKRPIEIKMAPPQVEQVIILNSNDIQFAEMEVDCQEIEHVVDDKRYVHFL